MYSSEVGAIYLSDEKLLQDVVRLHFAAPFFIFFHFELSLFGGKKVKKIIRIKC